MSGSMEILATKVVGPKDGELEELCARYEGDPARLMEELVGAGAAWSGSVLVSWNGYLKVLGFPEGRLYPAQWEADKDAPPASSDAEWGA